MLAHLEHENLFLMPLDEERHWYRYHPLFAEALRGRLTQAEPELLARLHRQAACWYAAHELLDDAVRHALSANDWDYASSLIENAYRRLIMNGEMTTLRAWLDSFPAPIIQARPRLALTYAWALGYSGPFERQEQMLHCVEAAVGGCAEVADPDIGTEWAGDAESRQLCGELWALRAMVASLRWESSRAIEFAQQAMWLLWPDTWAEFYQQPPIVPPAPEERWLRAVILHALGDAYRLDGNVRSAETTYREALRLTTGDGAAPPESFPLMALTAAIRLGQVLTGQGAADRSRMDLSPRTRPVSTAWGRVIAFFR